MATRWQYKDFYYNEHGDSCQHCGKGISNVFIIADESGSTMTVGSECVKLLTEGSLTTRETGLAEKRAKRAARQWLDFHKGNSAPKKLANETREQYINRRVAEMGRVGAAYRTRVALENKRAIKYRGKGHPSIIAASRLMKRWGIEYPGFGNPGYGAHEQLRGALAGEFNKRWQERVAKRLNCNAFDLFKAAWDVAKI